MSPRLGPRRAAHRAARSTADYQSRDTSAALEDARWPAPLTHETALPNPPRPSPPRASYLLIYGGFARMCQDYCDDMWALNVADCQRNETLCTWDKASDSCRASLACPCAALL